MASNPIADLLAESVASPLGEVIAAVGQGVADAQRALDEAAIAATLAIHEQQGDEGLERLREIGYRPTFYVLPDTACEVQVSMRIGGSGGADGSAGAPARLGRLGTARTYVTPVDAGFQQRYGFEARAAAKLTFRIVPVPPPAALDEGRPMPAVEGLTVDDALAALDRLGLEALIFDKAGASVAAETAGSRKIARQSVTAGRLVPLGAAVSLTLA
jgi:hypothetical protein